MNNKISLLSNLKSIIYREILSVEHVLDNMDLPFEEYRKLNDICDNLWNKYYFYNNLIKAYKKVG